MGESCADRTWCPPLGGFVPLLFFLACSWCLAGGPAAQTVPSRASVPASASAEARNHFRQGLAALHTFEYEDANEAFRRAQSADPGFALGYWGEAMTYNQTLWRRENVAAARDALRRLDLSAATRATKAGTLQAKALLGAVEILFGEGDARTRHQKYADAMGRLYEQDRDDPDVASLYALALMGTMSRSLIGYGDPHEGHVPGLAGSQVQKQIAGILDLVLQRHPNHPGALHYLVHNYDDPEYAPLGLAAARRLAAIAPDSSHARHMPAHIFLQLGMWRDAASSDRAAFDASSAWVARKQLGPALRNYHALAWLQYELLQRGKYGEAWNTIGELEPVVKATGQLPLLSTLSSMRARFVVETRRWSLMANERNFANVDDLFAIGMSAARSGNEALARMAREGLAARARSEREGDLRPAIGVMEQEVAALSELAGGRVDEAVRILRTAVSAELQLPPPLGLPEPVKPAPELLGEVLLEAGRPRDAVEPFEQALARNRNRSASVLGLARAHAAVGDTEASRRRYRELLANFDDADNGLPEVEEATRALENPPLRADRSRVPFVIVASLAIVLIVALAIGRMRGRKQRPTRPYKKKARR
jgi:tetratricopeptide (TPR) repeat protein